MNFSSPEVSVCFTSIFRYLFMYLTMILLLWSATRYTVVFGGFLHLETLSWRFVKGEPTSLPSSVQKGQSNKPVNGKSHNLSWNNCRFLMFLTTHGIFNLLKKVKLYTFIVCFRSSTVLCYILFAFYWWIQCTTFLIIC